MSGPQVMKGVGNSWVLDGFESKHLGIFGWKRMIGIFGWKRMIQSQRDQLLHKVIECQSASPEDSHLRMGHRIVKVVCDVGGSKKTEMKCGITTQQRQLVSLGSGR